MTDEIEINIVAAITEAQKNFPALIEKNKEAKIRGKAKGSGEWYEYSFSYADYGAIMVAVKEPLLQQDVVIVHSVEYDTELDKHFHYTRMLTGNSINMLETKLKIPEALLADPPALGGWRTYIERYNVRGMLSLATDDDLDAEHFQDNESEDHLFVDEETVAWYTERAMTLEIDTEDFLRWLSGNNEIKVIEELPYHMTNKLKAAGAAVEAKRAKAETKDE